MTLNSFSFGMLVGYSLTGPIYRDRIATGLSNDLLVTLITERNNTEARDIS